MNDEVKLTVFMCQVLQIVSFYVCREIFAHVEPVNLRCSWGISNKITLHQRQK